jgi:hypothetical protein
MSSDPNKFGIENHSCSHPNDSRATNNHKDLQIVFDVVVKSVLDGLE